MNDSWPIVIAGSLGASVHPMVMVTQPGTMVGASSMAGAVSCSASGSTTVMASAAMGNSMSGTGATWERASNQSSSPSHSQMSRNSSRKSNNSILVSNGKLEGLLFNHVLFSIAMSSMHSTTYIHLPTHPSTAI